MTEPRILTIPTRDFGDVTIECPHWCNGEAHQPGVYRVDITHTSDETEMTVDTPTGTALLLALALESRPFTERPSDAGVVVPVHIDGDHYLYRFDNLDQLAARLVEIAGEVLAEGRRLALLAGGAQ